MARLTHQYEVALSYASENASFVRRVYRRLRAGDRATFFAPEEASHLWGKNESEFERIYGPGSRYVVPFVSEHYVKKEWTRLEFRAARREAKLRKGEFILPVRLDGTPLPGLPRKMQYLDAEHFSPEQVADLLIEKLGSKNAGAGSRPSAAPPLTTPQVLLDEERDHLGLLATSVAPLPLAHLRALFPSVGWKRRLPRWRRLGFLARGFDGVLQLESRLSRRLLADKVAVRRWRETWVSRLTALREYPDTALLLSLQLLALRRVPDAVDVLIPIATNLEPGHWNSVYLSVFARFAPTRHIRNAQPHRRAQFLNAYGVLLTDAGEYAIALATFSELRVLSRRTRDAWGEGQSYINAGVAATKAGDERAARGWYRRAVAHGKRRRDDFLVGRALGNLAQLVDPSEADKLLSQSERLKTRAGDAEGLVGTTFARGNLAATQGRFVEASKRFRQAIRLAKRQDLRYLCALALRNLGRTEVDRGRPEKAYVHFQQSARICREEEFHADLAHAVACEALVRMDAKEYVRAGRLFDTLAELHRKNESAVDAAIALRDAGVTFALRRRRAEALERFIRAQRTFRRMGSSEWARRTAVDAASVTTDDQRARTLLAGVLRDSLAAQDFETADRATRLLLDARLQHEDLAGAVRVLDGALRSFPTEQRLPFLADRFSLLLELGDDRRLGPAFQLLVTAARKGADRLRVVDAHMALGDYLWAKDSDVARARGYQAFVVGMAEAIQVDVSTFARVATYILGRLYAATKRGRSGFIARLTEAANRWEGSDPREAEALSGIAHWPLQAVARIYELPGHGKLASARELQRILAAELRVALGTTASGRSKSVRTSRRSQRR